MVKYMKTFRKIQKKEWENYYFDYKSLKHYIKENLNNQNNEVLKNLTLKIDTEVRKIFVFYINKESKIYVSINQCLHNKENYNKYDEVNLYNELNILSGISVLLYDLVIYFKYNILALQKILKKIDKKFISITNKNFTCNYLSSKINDDGSDLNYIFKFKIINEVIPLIEELKNIIQTSLNNLNSNKTFIHEQSNLLIIKNNNETSNNIQSIKNKIEDYIKIINIYQGKIENPYRYLENIYKLWVIEYLNLNESTFDLNNNKINNNTKSSNNYDDYETILSFRESNYKTNLFILNLCSILYGIIEFIILTDDITFKNKNDNIFSYKKMTIIFICCPIGIIILSLFSIIIKICSFKICFILSIFFSLIGSILYGFNYNILFNIFGRFFIGLSINQFLLIKYIITSSSNKKINKNLKKNKFYNFLGKIISRIIIIISININKYFNIFNEIFYSSCICSILSFVLLIIIMSKFKINKKDFKYSVLNNNMNNTLNNSSELNEQLNILNIKQNNNSADLVSKSIQEIIDKTYIKNKIICILCCLIHLFATSTFYSFLIIFSINFTLQKVKLETYIIFCFLIILFCSSIFTFISKKLTQLRIILIPLIISNILIILIYLYINKKNNLISYILIGVILLISHLLNDLVLYLYEKLIIINYKNFNKISIYIFYLSGIIGIIIGYGNFYFLKEKELHLKILCFGYSLIYIFIFVYTIFIYKSLKVGVIQRLIKLNDINKSNSNSINL